MRGYEFCIPPDDVKRVDNYSLYRGFTLESVGQRNQFVLDRGHVPVVMEKHFHFDEELHRMCPNDVSLFGFFQTEKYFANIKDEIAETLRSMIPSVLLSRRTYGFDGFAPIFLHVRRGDPNLVDAGDLSGRTRNVVATSTTTVGYYEEL